MLNQKHTGKLPTTERSADNTDNRRNIDGFLERLTDVAGIPSVGHEASHSARSAGNCTVTNRFETFRCQACGRGVKRKSRQQRFCSDRCRQFACREKAASQINGRTAIKNASGDLDSGAVTNRHFLSSKNSELRGPKSGASVPLNVLGGYRWLNAVDVDRELLRKIVRAEIGAWVREKAEGIGSAPDRSDEHNAPPGAVRASAKSLPDAHSGTRRRSR
jgi:endogenous inhibitor of DNA gyrase (YacG/DUF329 family)